MSKRLPYWLAFAVLVCAAYAGVLAARHRPAAAAPTGASAKDLVPVEDRMTGDAFQLTDQDGQEFDSAELKGQVWIGSFFFSSCPSVCFKLNEQISYLQRDFGKEGVRFVSISVNPKEDTPSVLKEYAKRFGADHDQWTFLTGPMDQVQKIGVGVFRLPTAEGVHSEKAVIFDRQGRMAGTFNVLKPEELALLKKVLPKLLAEEAPEAEAAAAK